MYTREVPARRLTLRPLGLGDLDHLVELDRDPEVMRHISGGEATPRSVIAGVLLPRMLAIPPTRPGMGFFAIEYGDRGFVGWAHLRPDIVEPEWAEIGFRLRREVWGQGIAAWASRTLIERAFRDLGVDVISARTVPANARSRRVIERLGLTYVGDFEFPARELGAMSLPATPGVLYTGRRGDPALRLTPE